MFTVKEFAAGELIVEGNMCAIHAVHDSFAVLGKDGNLSGFIDGENHVMECVFLLEEDAEKQAAIWNAPVLDSQIPAVIDGLLVPDDLSEKAAAVLSVSEGTEYAIIEVNPNGWGDDTAFVVKNAPGMHQAVSDCPMGYGLRRWLRDAGFPALGNVHSLLFTEDIPAEDAIPFDGSTPQSVIDREPDSATADSRDAAGLGSF